MTLLKTASVNLLSRAPLRIAAGLLVALLCIAAARLVAAGSVNAGAPMDGVTIPYGDLDLSTIEGAVELERRLVEAASAVCTGLDTSAAARDSYDRCRMDAVAGAILTLRRPPSAVAAVTS